MTRVPFWPSGYMAEWCYLDHLTICVYVRGLCLSSLLFLPPQIHNCIHAVSFSVSRMAHVLQRYGLDDGNIQRVLIILSAEDYCSKPSFVEPRLGHSFQGVRHSHSSDPTIWLRMRILPKVALYCMIITSKDHFALHPTISVLVPTSAITMSVVAEDLSESYRTTPPCLHPL